MNLDGVKRSLYELLAYPDVTLADLVKVEPKLQFIDSKTAEALETESTYAVYLERQKSDAALMLKEEERVIPETLDFGSGPFQRVAAKDAWQRRPRLLAEAQRIDGMTPAALAIILSRAQCRGTVTKGRRLKRDAYARLQDVAGPVSRETYDKLVAFETVFRKWAQRINLVAPSTLDDAWERHILDSAQVVRLGAAKSWLDIGSGGGFPGLIIASMISGRDGASIDMVESNRKKAGFLSRRWSAN